MKGKVLLFGLLILWAVASLRAQTDSTRKMVKYVRGFKFTDGIYLNFNEFKNNSPSVVKCEIIENKDAMMNGSFVLKSYEPDSNGKISNKQISNAFGFCKNGVIYFGNESNGYFRMFIVGALSHFIALQQSTAADDMYYGYPAFISVSGNDASEYLLDFETGETFLFNYKNFRDFLQKHDTILYNELESLKNKREMIHHYLLKYNEKHPIYFPVR